MKCTLKIKQWRQVVFQIGKLVFSLNTIYSYLFVGLLHVILLADLLPIEPAV